MAARNGRAGAHVLSNADSSVLKVTRMKAGKARRAPRR
jgi:hypothetical protein